MTTLVLLDADNIPSTASDALKANTPAGAIVRVAHTIAAPLAPAHRTYAEATGAEIISAAAAPQAADMALAIATGTAFATHCITEVILASRDSDLVQILQFVRSQGARAVLASHAGGCAILRRAADGFIDLDKPAPQVRNRVDQLIRGLLETRGATELAQVGQFLHDHAMPPPSCGLKRWLKHLGLPFRIRGSRLELTRLSSAQLRRDTQR